MSTAVVQTQHQAEEDGVILTPEEEEELERSSAEAEEDLRAGRCITFDEMRAKLRKT